MQRKRVTFNNVSLIIKFFNYCQMTFLYYLLLTEFFAETNAEKQCLTVANVWTPKEICPPHDFSFLMDYSTINPATVETVYLESQLINQHNNLKFQILNVPVELDFFGKVAFLGSKKQAISLYKSNQYHPKKLPAVLVFLAYQNKYDLLKTLNLSKAHLTAAYIYLVDITYSPYIVAFSQIEQVASLHTKAMKFFIKHGAEINHGKNSPFIYASNIGDVELVQFLLDHGADMYKKSESTNIKGIPLQGIPNNDDAFFKIITAFLHHGYDMYYEGSNGYTLVNFIANYGNEVNLREYTKLMSTDPLVDALMQAVFKERVKIFINDLMWIFITSFVISNIIFYKKTVSAVKKIFSRLKQKSNLKLLTQELQLQSVEKITKKENSIEKKMIEKNLSQTTPQYNENEIPQTVTNTHQPRTHIPKIKETKESHEERAKKIAAALEAKRKAHEAAELAKREAKEKELKEQEIKKAEWKAHQEALKKEREQLENEKLAHEAALKLAAEKKKEEEYLMMKFGSKATSTAVPKHSQEIFSNEELGREIILRAGNIAVLNQETQVTSHNDQALNQLVNHFSMLLNIHYYNFAMLTYFLQNHVPNTQYKKDILIDIRNLLIHGGLLVVDRESVIATANIMQKTMPFTKEKLRQIGFGEDITDEDINKIINYATDASLESVFQKNLADSPLYQVLANHAALRVDNNFGHAKTIKDEDKLYLEWVTHKIIPLINLIAAPLLKNPLTNYDLFAPQTDAIKMLCVMCGEYFTDNRKSRLKDKISADYLKFLKTAHNFRNQLAHYVTPIATSKVIEISRAALKISSAMADANNLDYSIPDSKKPHSRLKAAATTSSSSGKLSATAKPFYPPGTAFFSTEQKKSAGRDFSSTAAIQFK